MPETPLSLARLAGALDLTEHQLLSLVASAGPQVPDPTLIALTVEEAARRLGVGRTTMYALVASGEIPSVTIGRLRRVPAEALKAYMAARVQAADTTVALAA
ncbi:helix-turn-helix domain-containing protein [Streptacidiphilus sp. PB12-B1b]|uniref:helix-turn-helix domain-containing protein n=1 Tax=Streptacidiphilus sp. PB12-B1b TaxID=2705012 RepID=UPI0015FB3CE4|nr:helix-turn-helix domain-containing protein [Streptacidiphilus sp. PB12-B1b]QMU74606.1 helix-turn-helix domain-containing protein [Streptacidiphilus sp. PB12-B1b]